MICIVYLNKNCSQYT